MKKITHKEIAKVLGVTASAITQRINAKNGFYVIEAQKLSQHFGTPIEAWADIKSFIANHKSSMPDTSVHVQVEPEEKSHLKETA